MYDQPTQPTSTDDDGFLYLSMQSSQHEEQVAVVDIFKFFVTEKLILWSLCTLLHLKRPITSTAQLSSEQSKRARTVLFWTTGAPIFFSYAELAFYCPDLHIVNLKLEMPAATRTGFYTAASIIWGRHTLKTTIEENGKEYPISISLHYFSPNMNQTACRLTPRFRANIC